MLDAGAGKVLVVLFQKLPKSINVASYDVVKVEIKSPIDVASTVERTVLASLTNSIIDLG